MNSFELNKILGAILGTCLVLLALNIGAGALFAPEKPAKPGFDIAVKEATAAAKRPAPPRRPSSRSRSCMPDRLGRKGPGHGQAVPACHTFEKGGPNRVGPNLWNIVGDERGTDRAASTISAAMKAKGGELDLRRAQQVPRQSARLHPRHQHDFAGLSRDQQRADVIDYLRTLADSPEPLPNGGRRRRQPAERRGEACRSAEALSRSA